MKVPFLSPQSVFLVSDAANIRYLSGFTGANPSEHETFLLLTTDNAYLLTNSLYEKRAESLCSRLPGYRYARISRTNPLSAALKNLLTGKSPETKTLFFEDHHLTCREFEELKNTLGNKIGFKPAPGFLESRRQIKTLTEIAKIKKACGVSSRSFRKIIPEIKTGVTEREIAAKLTSLVSLAGGTDAFAPIVAFSDHTGQPHHQPENFRLKKNTLILIDFGAAWDGYASDQTRMIAFGKIGREIQDAYRIVSQAKTKATEYLSANKNVPGHQADRLAKKTIADAGLPAYTHSLGHALGLNIHESPRLTVHHPATIRPGMVFTIEPATYLPDKFGIRIEDTVVKTNNGLTTLTDLPEELITIDV